MAWPSKKESTIKRLEKNEHTKYLKTIGNLHNSNRESLRDFLKVRLFKLYTEIQPLISSERHEKFKILELKAESLVHRFEEPSPRPPISEALANKQKTHFYNIFYLIWAVVLSIVLFFTLCFDGVTYQNIVTMINVKFKGHYDLASIQRKAMVLLSGVVRPQEYKFDYGALSDLQRQINTADMTPVLTKDLAGYYKLLDEFNFDEKFYDLCTINFMEEYVMIIDLCKNINQNAKLDSSFSIANQLANLESKHAQNETATIEPTLPYASASTFNGLYYLNSRNLQTIIVEKLNGILSAIFSSTISSKDPNSGYDLVDSLITNSLHFGYLADFIHHFTVGSLDILL